MTQEPMHPLRAILNGMTDAWQRDRAGSQMTLGALIGALEALPADRDITGFGGPHSYRGYYEDLAFEPSEAVQTVADLLATCRGCMGRVFEGYKGGEYVMGEITPVWIALYGTTGPRLMALDTDSDPIRPVTAEEEW
ncbi:MAG TPA: hypothetical protein VF158_10770 [Longimicrobiales bacterium]